MKVFGLNVQLSNVVPFHLSQKEKTGLLEDNFLPSGPVNRMQSTAVQALEKVKELVGKPDEEGPS